jgi:hypothetical protein
MVIKNFRNAICGDIKCIKYRQLRVIHITIFMVLLSNRCLLGMLYMAISQTKRRERCHKFSMFRWHTSTPLFPSLPLANDLNALD